MTSKRDPLHLLNELRWMSDKRQLVEAWVGGRENQTGISPNEFFCVLFDDLLIEDAAMIYDLSEDLKAKIEEIAELLDAVARRQPSNIDAASLLLDPDFLKAQRIATTV